MSPTVLKLAVCLFPGVTSLDFQGPLELFGFLSSSLPLRAGLESTTHQFSIQYLAPTLEPITPDRGPKTLADATYEQAREQFDVILVPGGFGIRPARTPPSLLEFLKRQAPGATYVLTVCTGSWVLAQAGLLEGRQATTNKAAYRDAAANATGVRWVPKARWVVDGNVWTSSGVTAGIDMAVAWLEHLVGVETTTVIRSIVEYSAREREDDVWAAYWGLV